MNWEEFKEKYKPVEKSKSKNFTEKYIYHNTDKIDRDILRLKNVMFIWTVICRDTINPTILVNGYKPASACGYIITEVNHDVEEEININL